MIIRRQIQVSTINPLVDPILLQASLQGNLQPIRRRLLGLTQEARVRRLNEEGHWITQGPCKALLNKRRQGGILVAEDVHGWLLVPGLKGSQLQVRVLGVRRHLGDSSCLSLGGDVVV
jgi:hypothetical protein